MDTTATTKSANLNFLEVLHEPDADQYKLDIVFIHGLNPFGIKDHAYQTWTHEKAKCFWPKKLLPKDVPTARVLLYGYNSFIFRNRESVNIRQLANVLLDRLDGERNRIGAQNKPIIFIAHSLGGVVVKQALINAKVNDSFRGILEHTHGLVFFGTPHKGSPKADVGNKLQMLLKPIMSGSQLLEALGTNSHSSQEHSDYFRHLINNFEVVTFFETKTHKIPLVGMAVPQSSSLMSSGKEIQLPIEGDHSSMCKFSSENDETYKPVINHIRRLSQNAIAKVEERGSFHRSKTEPALVTAPELDEKPPMPKHADSFPPPSSPYILMPRTPPPPPYTEVEEDEHEYRHDPMRDSGYGDNDFYQKPLQHPSNRQNSFTQAGAQQKPQYDRVGSFQMPSPYGPQSDTARAVIYDALHGKPGQSVHIPMPMPLAVGNNGYNDVFMGQQSEEDMNYYVRQHQLHHEQELQLRQQQQQQHQHQSFFTHSNGSYHQNAFVEEPASYQTQYGVDMAGMGGYPHDMGYASRPQTMSRGPSRQNSQRHGSVHGQQGANIFFHT